MARAGWKLSMMLHLLSLKAEAGVNRRYPARELFPETELLPGTETPGHISDDWSVKTFDTKNR
jgi:hypothetical protein